MDGRNRSDGSRVFAAGVALVATLVMAAPGLASTSASPGPPVEPVEPAEWFGERARQDPASPGGADTAAAPAVSDGLRVFLLTFGPGTAVWERFGHNALWIHDSADGTDRAYHYGLFDMSESGFLVRFLQGRMFYSMGEADPFRLMDAYQRAGRDATVQELRLTEPEAEALQAFLEWNLRPENRGYRYDYFRDNCSTRVRDALDDALGDRVSRALERIPTPITYRSEALSLTAGDALLTVGLDIGLGPLADTGLNRWQLGFIPMRLRDDLRGLSVETDEGSVPLVVREQRVPAIGTADADLSARPGRLDARVGWMLLAGLVGGGVVAGLGALAARAKGGVARALSRIGLALVGATWGLVSGVLGAILLGLWTLTDHTFAHANENLLQTDPLALALVVLVPLAVAGRATRAARGVAGLLLALSLLGLILHPLPLTPQANLGVIALALPIHAATFWAVRSQTGQDSPRQHISQNIHS